MMDKSFEDELFGNRTSDYQKSCLERWYESFQSCIRLTQKGYKNDDTVKSFDEKTKFAHVEPNKDDRV